MVAAMRTVGSEDLTRKIMNQCKNNWDECDRVGAQYVSIITTKIASAILKCLADVAPEQLAFAGNLKSKNQPSLQEFIRGRMKEHFEMVDRLGFGSFQDLITTAEEAMCEIWVTSLDIIESDRYQSSYTSTGQTTA
ncbi:hypothetical protein FRC11_009202 [Ceratobasidium sp. 423]|nr:hypothetical protein FRC11_009202 [Ceratobasidium sp. 423]